MPTAGLEGPRPYCHLLQSLLQGLILCLKLLKLRLTLTGFGTRTCAGIAAISDVFSRSMQHLDLGCWCHGVRWR